MLVEVRHDRMFKATHKVDRRALEHSSEDESYCIRQVERNRNVYQLSECRLLENSCVCVNECQVQAANHNLRRYVQRIAILMVGKATKYRISATKYSLRFISRVHLKQG